MNWYTSDTHFGHRNIIEYSNRPFTSVEDMDEALIKRWNDVVAPEDNVFHLGDFSMGKKSFVEYLRRLNGYKHLVWGNHDSSQIRQSDLWTTSQPYLEVRESGQFLVLSHYAMRVWNKSHRGAIMLYGHSHGSLPGSNQSVDVGVDNGWNYSPVNLDQILRRLRTLPEYLNVDHHGTRT